MSVAGSPSTALMRPDSSSVDLLRAGGHRYEGDLREMDALGVPVFGVLHQHELLVRDVALEHEGSRSHRVGPERSRGSRLRGHDEATPGSPIQMKDARHRLGEVENGQVRAR